MNSFRAIHVLNTTEAWQTFEKNDPCIKFLEMVHVVDLMQQCVQAYYEEDVVSKKFLISFTTTHPVKICYECAHLFLFFSKKKRQLLEKTEFQDKCLRKKKNFEKLLDENVAHGLDRTIDGKKQMRISNLFCHSFNLMIIHFSFNSTYQIYFKYRTKIFRFHSFKFYFNRIFKSN